MSKPFFFYLWYKLYRSKKKLKPKWFNKETTFYFDGYPRSGNTYMIFLMKEIYDEKNIIHHFHTIAPLKVALKKKIKSLIIIRNPIESVSSSYLKKFEKKELPIQIDKNLLETLLVDYITYYEYVKSQYNKIYLINFQTLINNPYKTLLKVDKHLNNLSGIKDENEFLSRFSNRKDTTFGSKSILGSSLPNIEKEYLKDKIKAELVKFDKFSNAEKLFINLIK